MICVYLKRHTIDFLVLYRLEKYYSPIFKTSLAIIIFVWNRNILLCCFMNKYTEIDRQLECNFINFFCFHIINFVELKNFFAYCLSIFLSQYSISDRWFSDKRISFLISIYIGAGYFSIANQIN